MLYITQQGGWYDITVLHVHAPSTEVKIWSRTFRRTRVCMRMYPKVSRLAAWSKNCKWYSTLPLGAVVSLFCESV
jgi:hypothetical protein